MSNHKSKIILITGCSSGFGYVTAKYLGEKGYTVIPTVRKKSDLTKLPNTGLLDVTWTQLKINRFIYSVIKKYGRIDVLINNAGFGTLGKIRGSKTDDLREQFETNLFGLHSVTKSLLPNFQNKHDGLIINVSSVVGLFTIPQYGIYGSSKYALEAYSAALRLEEEKNGLKVVVINPGNFHTNFIDKSHGHTPAGESDAGGENPLLFAKLVEKIINARNPKHNYLIGRETPMVWILLHLPSLLKNALLKRYFT